MGFKLFDPSIGAHLHQDPLPDFYDFRFVSEVLDDAESVADTFEVIRRGYRRPTVTFNTKTVTLATTGNVHYQSRDF